MRSFSLNRPRSCCGSGSGPSILMSRGWVSHLACFLVWIIAWSLLSGSIVGDRFGTVGPSDVAVKGLGDQAAVGGFPGRSLKSLSPSRDTAFVASEDGSIHLMDSDTGRVIWSLPLGPPIHSSYQAPINPENEKENFSRAGNGPFFIDVGEDWELYMYDELFQKTKLPISIDDFIKTTPVISEEGSVTLGSRKSTVFEVDLFTGRLIRTYGLSFSGSSSENIGVESDENGKDLVESEPLDSDLANRRLKITRTDYILQSFSPKSDKVLWNMTVAEIGAALICDDDSSGGTSRYQLGSDPDSLYDMPLPCQSRAIVYRFRNREQFDAFSRLQLDGGMAHPSSIPRQRLPSLPGLVKPSLPRPKSLIVPQLPALGDNLEDQNGFSTKVLELPAPEQSESEIIHHSLKEVFKADRRVLYFGTLAMSSLVLVLCLGIGIFVFWYATKPKEQNNPVDDSTRKTSPKRKKVRKSGKANGISDKKDNLTSAESEDRYSSPTSDYDALTRLNKFVDGALEGRKIGKLFVSNVEIAKGSNGTIVLEGMYEGRLVAVKRLVQAHHDVAFKEIQNLIASDRHSNIVRWYGVENDQDFVYLALERCTCSLDDLMQIYSDGARNLLFPEDTRALAEYKIRLDSVREVLQGTSLWKDNGHPSSLLLKLMRDVVCGLAHLHELGIIHRDLKPQNVLITKERLLCAKLSDMGISKRLHGDMSSLGYHATGCGSSGWQAPEQLLQGRQTRAVDMFSLGCVLFFCVSGGRHPFGERFERDINIVNNKVDLFLVESIPEAVDLFTRLLNPDPELRPKALDVLNLPLFWCSETRMSFLRDTSDRVELEDREAGSDLLTAMESIAPIALDGKWDEKLEPAFISDMGRYRRYKYDSIRDLLRLMRNKLNHYRELSPPIQELLGSVPEGFDNYFRSRFPRLLIEVYKVISNHCSEEPSFQKYFRGYASAMSWKKVRLGRTNACPMKICKGCRNIVNGMTHCNM